LGPSIWPSASTENAFIFAPVLSVGYVPFREPGYFDEGGTVGTHVDCPAPVTISGAFPSIFVVCVFGSNA
jgi:hypothetical protein